MSRSSVWSNIYDVHVNETSSSFKSRATGWMFKKSEPNIANLQQKSQPQLQEAAQCDKDIGDDLSDVEVVDDDNYDSDNDTTTNNSIRISTDGPTSPICRNHDDKGRRSSFIYAGPLYASGQVIRRSSTFRSIRLSDEHQQQQQAQQQQDVVYFGGVVPRDCARCADAHNVLQQLGDDVQLRARGLDYCPILAAGIVPLCMRADVSVELTVKLVNMLLCRRCTGPLHSTSSGTISSLCLAGCSTPNAAVMFAQLFDDLIGLTMPSIANQLEQHGVSAADFSIKWVATMFDSLLSFEHRLLLLDVLFAAGVDGSNKTAHSCASVLIKAGLVMLRHLKDMIMSSSSDEQLLNVLGVGPDSESIQRPQLPPPNEFLRAVRRVVLRRTVTDSLVAKNKLLQVTLAGGADDVACVDDEQSSAPGDGQSHEELTAETSAAAEGARRSAALKLDAGIKKR